MGRKLEFGVGEFYHVFNRGTDKRLIFLDDHDRERFLRSLLLFNSTVPTESRHHGGRSSAGFWNSKKRRARETLVEIGAYCLMPNHFHLLVREKQAGGLSLFMRKLLTSYSMYFNLKNKRRGALFESRFGATHANTDDYLRYLFAYIHLNPIKIIEPGWPQTELGGMDQAMEHLKNYRFSSYLDYQAENERPEQKILNKAAFPDYFQTPADFGRLLKDWLLYRAENDKNPTEHDSTN